MRDSRQRFHPSRITASAFALPSAVRGPVLNPPWNLQRPAQNSSLHWHGDPRRFLAPHILPVLVLGLPAIGTPNTVYQYSIAPDDAHVRTRDVNRAFAADDAYRRAMSHSMT